MTTTVTDSGVAELRDRVEAARSASKPLRVTGAEHWLDAGRPTHTTEALSTRELRGITSYVPGDLTLTARAGTTLAEIREATEEHNQWLALDPFGDENGTLGATVASGAYGPLATNFGTPRDLVLGVEFVSGIPAIVRGGGRVVKNVAGFDLTRLMIGSWGTLGVITEVTVRLHAKPEREQTIAIDVGANGVDRVRALVRRLAFTPYACEVLNGALSAALLGTDSTTALFRLGGNRDAVDAQRNALSELGVATPVDSAVWTKFRTIEGANAAVVRVSDLPSYIGATWAFAGSARGALIHATPARGVVRAICADAPAIAPLLHHPETITVIAERLPGDLWARVAPTDGYLPPRVKAAFDPSDILNPGILGVTP